MWTRFYFMMGISTTNDLILERLRITNEDVFSIFLFFLSMLSTKPGRLQPYLKNKAISLL
jgi:hypothetical protein